MTHGSDFSWGGNTLFLWDSEEKASVNLEQLRGYLSHHLEIKANQRKGLKVQAL